MRNVSWIKALPTYLTWSRMLAVPLLFVLYAGLDHPMLWVLICFVTASITDWLDGFIAKRYNGVSRFGAFLDPVADKLLVCSALIIMVTEHPSVWLAMMASVIIGREILISALREWMSTVGARIRVNVIRVAQIKTVFQVVGIALILGTELHPLCFSVGFVVLLGAIFLTLYSMVVYLLAAKSSLA